MSTDQFIELRIYKIHHGKRPAFEESMRNVVLPLFRRHKVEIIHHGPSSHDSDSYFLIRAYPSVEDRKTKLDALFSSAEWLMNHETYIMDMIDIISTAMFPADEWLVEMLKERFEGESLGEPISQSDR